MSRLLEYIQSHKTAFAIFAGAFAIRALYAIFVQIFSGSEGFIAFSDAHYFYFNEAVNLVNGHGFSIAPSEPYYPNAYHTPLYPLFLALLLLLKMPLVGIVLIQSVFAALTVTLFYLIARQISNSENIAIVTGALAAVEPMSIYWGGLLMSDVIFAFFLTLSFYLLLKGNLVLMSLSLGLSAMVRPIALLFIPVFVAFVLFQSFSKQKDWSSALRNALLVAILASVVVSPWFVRNKVVFDTWSMTSAGWYDLYVSPIAAYAQENNLPFVWVHPDQQGDRNFTRFSFAYTPMYKAMDLAVIQMDVPGYLRFQILRSLSSLFTDRYEYLITTVLATKFPALYNNISQQLIHFILSVGQFFWYATYFLVATAFLDRKNRHWWLFFLALVGINAAISGGINPGGSDMARYSLAFAGPLFMLAGIGIIQVQKILKSTYFKRS
jgi:4-amino-4-deoxy-L-arabinose transferase-like glycosyltransferase